MAYAIDAATKAQLQAGEILDRYMVKFAFDEGTFGFWGGVGTLTHDSQTYTGAGSLIELDELVQGVEGEAIALVLKLTAVPNSDLSPDILASIDRDYTWHQRVATVMTAYFTPANVLLSVETEGRFYIDRLVFQHGLGGESVLMLYLESKARDLIKTGYRIRSDEDQKLIDSNDCALRHTIDAATIPVIWGRAPEEAAGGKNRRDVRRQRREARRETRQARRAARGRLFG